jgi:plasmid stabilization system protein ParE
MRIIWTEPAVADLQNNKAYISNDSGYYAAVMIEKILKSVERIKDFPRIGREVPEFEESEIREVIYSNDRIMYRIHEDFILVLAVVHGKEILKCLT